MVMRMMIRKVAEICSGHISVNVYRDIDGLLCIEATNVCTKPSSKMVIKSNCPKIIYTFIDYELYQWLDDEELDFVRERIDDDFGKIF